uniref:Dicer-like 5 n=1 Tax=Paramecium bursaria TaxID=74790 RepID=A0A8G1FWH1_9CILI|nr:dicer-like 5 [Paramecium bursaria]
MNDMDCLKVNQILSGQQLQYDIPFSLMQPYKSLNIFYHYFNNRIGFITSCKIEKIFKPINLYYKQRGSFQKEEYLVLEQNKQAFLSKEEFLLVYDYNVQYQSDLFKISPKQHYKHQVPLENLVLGGARNYLFVPILNGQIDFQDMKGYLGFLQFPGHIPCVFNPENDIYYQIYRGDTNRTTHCLFRVFENIWHTSCYDLLIYVLSLMPKKILLNDAYKHFGIDIVQARSLSIGTFLYDFNFSEQNQLLGINTLRSLDKKLLAVGLNIRPFPICIMHNTLTIRQVSFYNEDQIDIISNIKDSEISVKSARGSNKPINYNYIQFQISFIPSCQLYRYYYDIKRYDQFMRLPTIMLEAEQQIIVSEFAKIISVKPSQTIQDAITRPSCSKIHNYQRLETLGDSILKFIATFYLVNCTQNTDQNELSLQRNSIVCNEYLGISFFTHQKLAINYFIRHFGRQKDQKWQSSVLQNMYQCQPNQPQKKKDFQNNKSALTYNHIADIYESLLGAIFQDRFLISDVYQFLQSLNHPACTNLMDIKYITNMSIMYMSQETQELREEMTFRQLLNQKSLVQITNIEKGIIFGYKFNNPYILQEAINIKGKPIDIDLPLDLYYQYLQNAQIPSQRSRCILEFLGDSVLECFIMVNCFNRLPYNLTPTDLYRIKMLLVSNSFMAKLSYAYDLHKIIEKQLSDIEFYKQNIDLDQDFRYYCANFVRVPKILSDFFEALCGAIFMDGGWDAIIKVYGLMYDRFIQYSCMYLQQIDGHVIERIHQYSLTKQQTFQCKITKEGNLSLCEIIILDKVVGYARHQHERTARERAAENACRNLKL